MHFTNWKRGVWENINNTQHNGTSFFCSSLSLYSTVKNMKCHLNIYYYKKENKFKISHTKQWSTFSFISISNTFAFQQSYLRDSDPNCLDHEILIIHKCQFRYNFNITCQDTIFTRFISKKKTFQFVTSKKILFCLT